MKVEVNGQEFEVNEVVITTRNFSHKLIVEEDQITIFNGQHGDDDEFGWIHDIDEMADYEY
jgi:hypothetical protein